LRSLFKVVDRDLRPTMRKVAKGATPRRAIWAVVCVVSSLVWSRWCFQVWRVVLVVANVDVGNVKLAERKAKTKA
jgi:hypothetical protein